MARKGTRLQEANRKIADLKQDVERLSEEAQKEILLASFAGLATSPSNRIAGLNAAIQQAVLRDPSSPLRTVILSDEPPLQAAGAPSIRPFGNMASTRRVARPSVGSRAQPVPPLKKTPPRAKTSSAHGRGNPQIGRPGGVPCPRLARIWPVKSEPVAADAPTMLIIGDFIIRDVQERSSKTLCYRRATVRFLAEKIPRILKNYPSATKVVIHVGTNDIGCHRSELLKRDFGALFCLLRRHPWTTFFISGPIPTLGRGIELFSRLLGLDTWLHAQCRASGLVYIGNFNLFWERPSYYREDGRQPSRFGSLKLRSNILHSVCVCPGWV